MGKASDFRQGIGFEPTVVFPKGADLYNEGKE